MITKVGKVVAATSLFLSLGNSSLQAETLTCSAPCSAFPGDPTYGCQTRTKQTFAWQNHFVALTRLGNHWMPSFGDGDSKTVPFSEDQDTSPPNGSDGLRETWYVARDSPGTNSDRELYRYYSSSLQNYLDSPTSSQAGYVQDRLLGYPWRADLGGMKPLRRYYNSSISDHRTWLFDSTPATPAGYSLNATWWETGTTPRLGYQRFTNLPDQCQTVAQGEGAGTVLQNTKLRVRFNKIWGNAIGEITYQGQDLVSSSIGDMVQSVLWYGGPTNGPQLNPTQSGGVDHWDYGNTKKWAGSPVLSETVTTGSPSYMVTTVKPLNFEHDAFTGLSGTTSNDPWSPLLWRGQFRETTTLGCKVNGTLKEDVIKIKHEATRDADATLMFSQGEKVDMMEAGFFLLEPLGNCGSSNVKVDLINTATGSVLQTASMACDQLFTFTQQTGTAIRITGGVGTTPVSIGMMRLGTFDGYRAKIKTDMGNGSTVPVASQKLILETYNFHDAFTPGVWDSEEVFLVIGDAQTVLTRLMELRTDGGDCLN
jgi:hypothetical protein